MLGTDIGYTDIFLNLTTIDTQLLSKGVPWRGAWEKDSKSIAFVIQGLTKCGVVVLDAYASICNDNHRLTLI